MAATILTDARVEINSVVMTTFVRQVTLSMEAEDQDTTAMGGNGYRARLAGLKDWSVSLEFNQDYAAAAVDATLYPLFATNTTIKIRPTSAAVSATNPEYSGSVLVSEYTPLDGSVGDVSTTTIPFQGNGVLARAVA